MTEPVSGGTGAGLGFTIQIDATRDPAVDADRVEALLTIPAPPRGTPPPAAPVAESLITDPAPSLPGPDTDSPGRAAATAGIIRHAVLYTDGKNEHESRPELDAALTACADRFICDVRGVGDDWDYTELLHIAGALHGDATAVLRIADLADDFTGLMR